MAPTEDETKSLGQWLSLGGSTSFAELAPPEKFLAAMGTVLRMREKTKVLLFARQFPGQAEEARQALHAISSACQQVSQPLPDHQSAVTMAHFGLIYFE